jgi:hypothetical protein
MRALIRRLSRENVLWSAETIHGHLVLLGFDPPCPDTIRKYIVKPSRGTNKSQTWLTFLRNHVPGTSVILTGPCRHSSGSLCSILPRVVRLRKNMRQNLQCVLHMRARGGNCCSRLVCRCPKNQATKVGAHGYPVERVLVCAGRSAGGAAREHTGFSVNDTLARCVENQLRRIVQVELWPRWVPRCMG